MVLELQATKNQNMQKKRPFLYRIWKFLQVTATEVIKGESMFAQTWTLMDLFNCSIVEPFQSQQI